MAQADDGDDRGNIIVTAMIIIKNFSMAPSQRVFFFIFLSSVFYCVTNFQWSLLGFYMILASKFCYTDFLYMYSTFYSLALINVHKRSFFLYAVCVNLLKEIFNILFKIFFFKCCNFSMHYLFFKWFLHFGHFIESRSWCKGSGEWSRCGCWSGS